MIAYMSLQEFHVGFYTGESGSRNLHQERRNLKVASHNNDPILNSNVSDPNSVSICKVMNIKF